VADDLKRQTGVAFDVHGHVWTRPAQASEVRWEQELRPARDKVLAKLEAFRAAGHKSLHAAITIAPAAAERALWQKNVDHLTELCEVSQIVLATDDADVTTITVAEAAMPECPRCWRRTGSQSGHPEEPSLCVRCASVVKSLEQQ